MICRDYACLLLRAFNPGQLPDMAIVLLPGVQQPSRATYLFGNSIESCAGKKYEQEI